MWASEAEVIIGFDCLTDSNKTYYSQQKQVFLDPKHGPMRQAACDAGVVYRVKLHSGCDFAFACAADAYNYKHVQVRMRLNFNDFAAIIDAGGVWESGGAAAWIEHGNLEQVRANKPSAVTLSNTPITILDKPYLELTKAAKSRGVPLEALIHTILNGWIMQQQDTDIKGG